jgi:hypothetical protein
LPDAFREVIVLRETNDLSYREIADITGVPVGTVMSRLARISRLMRCSQKEKTAWRSSSTFDMRSRTPSASGRLFCGEAVKQASAAGFRQTRLIAANRRVS